MVILKSCITNTTSFYESLYILVATVHTCSAHRHQLVTIYTIIHCHLVNTATNDSLIPSTYTIVIMRSQACRCVRERILNSRELFYLRMIIDSNTSIIFVWLVCATYEFHNHTKDTFARVTPSMLTTSGVHGSSSSSSSSSITFHKCLLCSVGPQSIQL